MSWDWTKARTYKVHMPVPMLREQQYYVMASMKRQYDEYVASLEARHSKP